jgi:hypothetical protein
MHPQQQGLSVQPSAGSNQQDLQSTHHTVCMRLLHWPCATLTKLLQTDYVAALSYNPWCHKAGCQHLVSATPGSHWAQLLVCGTCCCLASLAGPLLAAPAAAVAAAACVLQQMPLLLVAAQLCWPWGC